MTPKTLQPAPGACRPGAKPNLFFAAVLASVLLAGALGRAQTPQVGAYRSAATGNWNSSSTWQRWDGTSWITQGTPTSSADVITIRAGHTVTLTANVTADQLVVEAGGQLTINSGQTLTLANGPGTDLEVYGIVRSAGTHSLNSGASIVFESGSKYQHNFTTTEGVIPTATWAAGSTCEIIGYTTNEGTTSGAGWGQSFHHFTWNCPNQTSGTDVRLGGYLMDVNGDFTVLSTGSGSLRLTDNTSGAVLDLAGNFVQSGGTFKLSGAAGTSAMTVHGSVAVTGGTFDMSGGTGSSTLNVAGNLSLSGSGVLTKTGSGVAQVNFNGEAAQGFTNSGSIANAVNFTVNNGATLLLGTNLITGSGNFTNSDGATLGIGEPNGIAVSGASGNIRCTGTRSLSPGASYLYCGNVAQVTGNGLPGTVDNLSLSNSAGLALSGPVTVTGTLTLSDGKLTTTAQSLSLGASATVSGAASSRYIVGPLRKLFDAGPGQAFTFPVGDPASYSPVDLSALTVLSAGSVTARATAGDHPALGSSGLDSTRDANRYWTLTGADGLVASAYDLQLNFSAEDVDAGATPSTFVLVEYAGGAWTPYSAMEAQPTYTKATVSGGSFGDFAVGEATLTTATRLVVTLPGETFVPGSGNVGTPGVQTAGTPFDLALTAVDDNLVIDGTFNRARLVTYTGPGGNPVYTTAVMFTNGQAAVATTLRKAETTPITASTAEVGGVASSSLTVNPGPAARLQVLLPGETAAPGTLSGKSGSPAAQTAGTPVSGGIRVNAVDACWNPVTGVAAGVLITSSDTTAVIGDDNGEAPGDLTLVDGAGMLSSLTFKAAGSRTITASDAAGSLAANVSSNVTVNAGAFTRLQVLVPGESPAPGTAAGKTGAPSAQNIGTVFTVTVNAADELYNVVAVAPADTIHITTTDPFDTEPSDGLLAGGTRTFSITAMTNGPLTITAADTVNGDIGPETSAEITVFHRPYFRSVANGNWNAPATWERSLNDGATWVAGAATPSAATADSIVVTSGCSVTNTTSVTVDDLMVEAGGVLRVNGGTLSIADSASTTNDVEVAGTLEILSNHPLVFNPGARIHFNGGTYKWNASAAGTIPPAANVVWDTDSTCEIANGSSGTAPSNLNQSFYHFYWNWPSCGKCDLGGNLTAVRGNLRLRGTTDPGNSLRFLAPTSGGKTNDLMVGRDVVAESGYITTTGGNQTNTVLNLFVGGNFTILSGAVWDSRNNGPSGSSQNVYFTNTTAAQTFSNAGTITRSGSPPGTPFQWHVGPDVTLNLAGGPLTLVISNGATDSLTVDGVLNCGTSAVNGQGAFTLNAGATLGIGHPGGVEGNITTSGAKTLSAGANYTYNGAVAQATGALLPATVNNLTFDNAAGLTLGGSTTVNGALLLSSGVLVTGPYQVGLAPGATVSGASVDSYVCGTVQKFFDIGSGQSLTFPIGDASGFAPVSLASLDVTVAGSLSARTTLGDHPNISTSGLDAAKSVNRYWSLAQDGALAVTGEAAFNYLATDVDAGAIPARFVVRRFDSGVWSPTTLSGTPTATAASISGLSQFGDFALGNELPANQSITFPALADKTYGDAPFTLSATASSGLPVSFSRVSGPATVAGDLVTLLGAGTVTVRASQGGNAEWNPAPDVEQSFAVAKANSALALNASQNPSEQGSNVVFTATVTPLLPATVSPSGTVQFFTNGAPCGDLVPLSGGVGSLSTEWLPAGSNTVTAVYGGEANFLASTNSLVQVVNLNLQRPSTRGITNNGDGTVTICFSGSPGGEYVVQAASELGAEAAWENVATNTAGADGQWTMTDSVTNRTQRYYRAAK